MPKINRKLTEAEIKNAKPRDKDYKLYDGESLRLVVRKSGTKVWQYPYTLNGKSNVHTIGQYDPNSKRPGFIGAAEARRLRDEAKALVKKGIDPNQMKRMGPTGANDDTGPSFETVAREWHGKQVWDKKHAQNILMSLEKDVFPTIGTLSINKVMPHDILNILKVLQDRDALDVARRVNQRCTAIFEYAINSDYCDMNPALGRSKTIKSYTVTHRPHISHQLLPDFLSQIAGYRGSRKIALAMHLLLLTFVRPGELRNARWSEFDFDRAEWLIPKERMKMKRAHLVPLSPQALELLNELKVITGKCDLLFPSELNSNKPISDVTLSKMLKIIGFDKGEKKLVPHGIRGTASTILNESRIFRGEVVEKQLSHDEKNKVRAAYNHAEYLDERIIMMNWWGNYLYEKTLSVTKHAHL